MKAYTYNNQKVITLNHIKKNVRTDPYRTFSKNTGLLTLNKDFFVIPMKEAQKIVPRYNSPNAILLTREGCKKLLYLLVDSKKSRVTKFDADYYLNKTFGVIKMPKAPKTVIAKSPMPSLFDIDESLAQMSTNSPLIQLIIDKAAEKVADRIISRLSA